MARQSDRRTEADMRWFLWIILGVFAMAAQAHDVPKSVVAKVNRDARKYVDEVTVLILGFGSGGICSVARTPDRPFRSCRWQWRRRGFGR
jgi:hypothetical protein